MKRCYFQNRPSKQNEQNKRLRDVVFITMGLLLLLMTHRAAADIHTTFQQGLTAGTEAKSNAQQTLQHFNPENVFKNYSDHPGAEKYYQGITQANDNGLNQEAAQSVSTDPTGSVVERSAVTHPVITINQNSPALQKGALIESDASDIATGISDKYVDCQAVQQCTTTYLQKTCDEAVRNTTQTCTDIPNVTIQNVPDPFPNCVHVVLMPPNTQPPTGSTKIGPWDTGSVWLVPGPDSGGNCAATYAYALGTESEGHGTPVTVPAGFAATLFVERSDDFCHAYGRENSATLTTGNGQALVVAWPASQKTAPLNGQIPDQPLLVAITLKNHHWSGACNLASFAEVLVPAQIEIKKPEVTWHETCTS